MKNPSLSSVGFTTISTRCIQWPLLLGGRRLNYLDDEMSSLLGNRLRRQFLRSRSRAEVSVLTLSVLAIACSTALAFLWENISKRGNGHTGQGKSIR